MHSQFNEAIRIPKSENNIAEPCIICIIIMLDVPSAVACTHRLYSVGAVGCKLTSGVILAKAPLYCFHF